MKHLLVLLLPLLVVMTTMPAGAATLQQLRIENEMRDSITRIVEKADPNALVRVRITLNSVTAALPGVWFEAQSTPLTKDGDIGQDSISQIQVTVVTQADQLPDWVRAQVSEAAKVEGAKVDVKYEKARGKFENANAADEKLKESLRESMKEVPEALKSLGGSIVDGSKGLDGIRTGLLILVGALATMILIVAMSIFWLGRRFETAMSRVITETLVPALAANAQSARGGSRGGGERDVTKSIDKPMQIQLPSGGGSGAKELAELPIETLLTILADCYWTNSDGYGHYLWGQMSQRQREEILQSAEAKAFLEPYFSFVRQFDATNLGYHTDAGYFGADAALRSLSQEDLAKWLIDNQTYFGRLTPLRRDFLPISLADRVRMSVAASNEAKSGKPADKLKSSESFKFPKASAARVLPLKLDVKTLSPADEDFVWNDSSIVPAELRSSLKTLVWLALAPLEDRRAALETLDARQLAEAWTGPAAALEKLKEAVPPKKLELVESYLKESTPDRESDSFQFLVEAGVEGLAKVDKEAS